MKRASHLIEKIAETENLFFAFYKAAKTKHACAEVVEYTRNLDNNLKTLQTQLIAGNVPVGNYHYFKIYDPKERTICAASFNERVVHHAIMNVCHPFFEKHLIFDSYATRPGKGTYAALEKAKKAVKNYAWVAKLDIRKYFDNISHEVLKLKLRRLFKDDFLLKLFESIINSYCTMPGKGIPIGNLTSQYFANHYLSSADHFAKEHLQIPVYLRYMDDMLLFENDKEVLKRKVENFCNYIETTMFLNFKPQFLHRTVKGLSFLGYKLLSGEVKLNSASKNRFKKKITMYYKLLNNYVWCQKKFSRHALPLIAFTDFAAAKSFRKKFIFVFEGQ